MARADPPRLRGRPGPAGRVGRRPRTWAHRPRPPRAAPLRGRDLRARGVEVHRCAQAGRHPRLLPRAARTRGGGGQPRATWCPARAATPTCPRVLKPGEVGELLEQMPAATPLELRDRAMFELAYSAGLRAEELVNLDVESSTPTARSCGSRARAGGRACPAGEPAWRGARGLPRPRPARLATEPAERALLLSRSGRRLSTSDVRRRLRAADAARGAPGRASRPTPCATRSPPICWRAARTCARSRSCSGTPPSARPRPTLG